MGPRAGLEGAENLASTGIGSPERPACSESLYRLIYPSPEFLTTCHKQRGGRSETFRVVRVYCLWGREAQSCVWIHAL